VSELTPNPYSEGKAAGRLELARELCTALTRKHHRSLLRRVEPIVATCQDPARLAEWTLRASELDDVEFLEMLGVDPKAHAWEHAREVANARQLCVSTVRRTHPLVHRLVGGLIDRCTDLEQLEQWTAAAPTTNDDEFFRLVIYSDHCWKI